MSGAESQTTVSTRHTRDMTAAFVTVPTVLLYDHLLPSSISTDISKVTDNQMKLTVKILFNARAFTINNAFYIEGGGRLLEATLVGNVQAFIYRI